MVALMLTVFLGISALVIDVGNIMLERQKLHDALDAAVLAGAAKLIDAKPTDELYQLANVADEAELTATSYAKANDVHNPNFEINPSKREIKGTGQKKVMLSFARFLGYEEFTIDASSKAKARPISNGMGFAPLGVVAPDPTNTTNYGFNENDIYEIKKGPQFAITGNFGALDLKRQDETQNSGADSYEVNLKKGYDGILDIEKNSLVSTKPGNMPVSTVDGIYDRITLTGNRLFFLPVIDTLPTGKGEQVRMIGFAAFYITDYQKNWVKGKFVKHISQGGWAKDESLEKDFGFYSVKLVK